MFALDGDFEASKQGKNDVWKMIEVYLEGDWTSKVAQRSLLGVHLNWLDSILRNETFFWLSLGC